MNTTIRVAVMRRVWRIWFIRQVLPFLLAEIAVLGMLAVYISQYISFHNVLSNVLLHAKLNPTIYGEFISYGYMNNTLVIQILLVALAAVILMFVRDFTRMMKCVVSSLSRSVGNLSRVHRVT